MGGAGILYCRSGVVRDVPELGIKMMSAEGVKHSAYNSRIYGYDRAFRSDGRVRVLVVGNSFARDWANVLLESKDANRIDVSYVYDPAIHPEFKERAGAADVIFFSTPEKDAIAQWGASKEKVYAVGTKNFGACSGIFYNYRGPNYCGQRTRMIAGVAALEEDLSSQWGDRYVSLIATIIDADGTVPVFTPECQFISVDCRHLTQAGAKMFASLLKDDVDAIVGSARRGALR
jgi:hypothetical protein